MLGGCERIRNTPIPFSYSSYIKQFVMLYALVMPFGLVREFGYGTVIASMFTFFATMGLELLATEIEEPFGTDINDLPADIKAKVLEVQEKAGFVPNVFLGFARRPAEWRAFFAYHDALMVPESVGRTSGLSKGEREMIVTTTSAANNCLYCVVAHGAILRIYEKKPLVADQVAVNHRKADITPRQRAMLDFAMKTCTASHTLEEADFEALRAHGFSDEDAWDIGAITAFFGLSNRMANLTGMRPNDEFFLMGRLPKS